MKKRHILILAPPQSRRVAAFQASLQRYGLAPARVLDYRAYLRGAIDLKQEIQEDSIFRIESTGEDCQLEHALLALGAHQKDEEGYLPLSLQELAGLQLEQGEVMPSRQWFLGYRALLERLQTDLQACATHRLMSQPRHILSMFDKRACHQKLSEAGIAVPPALAKIESFDALEQAMTDSKMRRVFVKLAHSSSASGVMALATNGKAWQATSTVQRVEKAGTYRYYNATKLQHYRDKSIIKQIIDHLCQQRVHVEQWLPKASLEGKIFDMRVVVIAGKAQHVLLRMGKGTITNLHLGNQRGKPEALRRIIPPEHWQAMLTSCERAAQLFDDNLYVGVDSMFTSNFCKHAILELNAFGDYHRGIYVNGRDTYGAELAALGVAIA